jgi:hypothetical protein
MNPLKQAKGAYMGWKSRRSQASLLSATSDPNIQPGDFPASLRDPSSYYVRAFQELHKGAPAEIREHREYFKQEQRGFGEDAFHTMWWLLVGRFKPASFLEIGVYRGQVLSLVSLLTKRENVGCHITGISPFSPAGDSVSTYLSHLDYLEDTRKNFSHFGLPEPELVKAYSTDASALDVIASREWDMIYIDGNHDYDVVVKDWAACSSATRKGGIIVLDDSGLTTGYRPPPFATGGHPGPSKLASEINPAEFEEILQIGHNRVFKKL